MRGIKLKREKQLESRSEAGRGVGEDVCFNFFEFVSHTVKIMQPFPNTRTHHTQVYVKTSSPPLPILITAKRK